MEVDEQRREAALGTGRRATRPAQGSAKGMDHAQSLPEFDAVYAWTPRDRVIVKRMITHLADVFVEVENRTMGFPHFDDRTKFSRS